MSLLPSFPMKRGYYTVMELKLIATVLGYDGNLFQRCLKRRGIDINQKSRYSDAEFREWLDNHIFDYELEHVYNQYAAAYNVKLIKKVMVHLYYRSLTYNEISDSRIAFETITARERQLVLPVDKTQVQMALKMVNKVLPPTKLHHLLQAMSQHFDTPNNLSLYNFLDIVARADDIGNLTFNNRSQTTEPQLEALFETPYQQLLTKLDAQYKASLLKLKAKRINTAKIPAISTSEQQRRDKLQVTGEAGEEFLSEPSHIQTKQYREAVERAIQSREAITPSVAKTTMMIHLARAGNKSLSSTEGYKTFSRISTTQPSRRTV